MSPLDKTMIALALELQVAVKALLISKGVKANSNVLKSVEVKPKTDLIQLLANDYLEYLSTGRKPGGRKVPIKYILQFIKEHNIKGRRQSQQSLVFAVAKSIQERRGSATMPPTADLKEWVQKNIEPQPISDVSLAFAIQTNIYKKGKKGKNFMVALFEMIKNSGEKKITADVEKTLLHTLDKIKIN